MQKEEINIEYVFDKASKNTLWNYLTTSSGLSEWFADDVSIDGDTFIFTWNKHPMPAKIISIIPFSQIIFQWEEEEEPDVHFGFRLHVNELTGGIVFEIIDFAEPEEKENTISLWDSQVKVLKRTLGI